MLNLLGFGATLYKYIMDKSNKSGAEALIHSLHLEGVDLMFGYPGGAALHINDAIFNQNYVDHILVRHEPVSYTHLTLPTICSV